MYIHPAEQAMQRVTIAEVLDNPRYEQARPEFRAQVLAEKEKRRVGVGPAFTFLFENHLTVLYQVQEMLRIEGITEPKAIQHEVDTYNDLVPPPGGLSASLLIDYEDPETRARELPRLLGIENHVWLKVGDLPPVAAAFDARQIGEDRVSSVQYVTFALPDVHRRLWPGFAANSRPGGQIKLLIDHPHYTWETALARETAQALQGDLQ